MKLVSVLLSSLTLHLVAAWIPCKDRYASCVVKIFQDPFLCYGALNYHYDWCAGSCSRCVCEDVKSSKTYCSSWKARGFCEIPNMRPGFIGGHWPDRGLGPGAWKAVRRVCKKTCGLCQA